MKNIFSFLNVGPGPRVCLFHPCAIRIGRIPVYIFITWDKGTCHPSYYIYCYYRDGYRRARSYIYIYTRIGIPIWVHISYTYTSTAGPAGCDFANQSETVHERHCTRTCTHSCALSNGFLIDSHIRRTHRNTYNNMLCIYYAGNNDGGTLVYIYIGKQ